MRDWLPRFALDRPVTVVMAFLASLVLGVLAYVNIPLQLLPEGFEVRSLWVRVPFPNATPAEADALVVRPIHEQLSTLPGIKSISSEAEASSVGFDIEFHPSVDMADAYNDVVDRIERAMPDLPDDIERYWIFKFSPTDEPVLWLGVTFPDDLEDPWNTVEKVVKPDLDRVPGVASVDSWGVDARRVLIEYDRGRLIAHGVNLGDVQQRLGRDNFQRSGGVLRESGQVVAVRSLAAMTDPDELRHWPAREDGLKLGDFADVSLRQVSSADINRVNGRDSAALAVRKESSANTVDVTAALREVLDGLEADPRAKGLQFFPFFDQGKLIADSVGQLKSALLQGGLLSILILWAFLREWRITVLVAACIPFSLLMTIAVMWLNGSSLNLIAMMGLMLAVGMVVDNAIVVVESIYVRRMRGESPRDAAIDGAGEVGLAILASTATTMIVFLPVILMTEDADASFFLGVLGLPVVWSLAASMVVALVFMPLATRFLDTSAVKPDPVWITRLSAWYDRALDVTLRRRSDAAMVLLAGLMLTTVAVRGVACDPGGGGGMNDFSVRFTVPPEADYYERDAIARRFEAFVESHRDDWGVDVYRVSLDDGEARGRVSVFLVDDGPMAKDDVIDAAKAALPSDIPGVVASIGWDSGGDDAKVTLTLYGEDTEVLRRLGDEVARRAAAVDGVLSAEVGSTDARHEIQLRPDAEALRHHGVSSATLGQTIAFAMRGTALEPLGRGDDEIEVETRLRVEDRKTVASLLDFPIWAPASMSILPARALTDITYGTGPTEIDRTDGRTSEEVTVDLARGVEKSDVVPRIDAALDGMAFPRGYGWEASDWAADQAAELDATFFAIGMSIVFVYLLMGVMFESWILPLSILTTLPMAGLGAWWALYLTDTSMDTMAGLGLVVLIGVVVNNGIVLVDAITQLRGEGIPRDEAIRLACTRRLRPILMTALTTIVGLVPMAAGSAEFIGIPYAPLGRTLMGGMISSTVLTLLFVPYAYVVLDELRHDGAQRLAGPLRWVRRKLW